MESTVSRYILPMFIVLSTCFILEVPAFPTGAPLSACGHLLPVHIDGELQDSASPYVLILNETTYSNRPIKLTVSTVGPGARDFMAFMLQGRSEFGEPAGTFQLLPQASKTIDCYGPQDTLTHTAAFIRPAMEVVWTPPEKNIGKITISGSVAESKIKYWAVSSDAIGGTGKLDLSGNRYAKPNAGGDADRNIASVFVVACALIVKALHL